MTNYAPNYTGRVKIHYSVLGVEHVMGLRTPRTTPFNDALVFGVLDPLMTALQGELFPITFDSVWYATSDSNMFLPVTSEITGTTYGTITVPTNYLQYVPCQLTFSGITGIATKTRLTMFGSSFFYSYPESSITNDFKIKATENTNISDAISWLNTATMYGADAEEVLSWYPQALIGYNKAWVRNVRKL